MPKKINSAQNKKTEKINLNIKPSNTLNVKSKDSNIKLKEDDLNDEIDINMKTNFDAKTEHTKLNESNIKIDEHEKDINDKTEITYNKIEEYDSKINVESNMEKILDTKEEPSNIIIEESELKINTDTEMSNKMEKLDKQNLDMEKNIDSKT